MNQPLPPNSDPQSTPEPGIGQQLTNSTLANLSYGQVRQGSVENVQVIGGNLTMGNITQVTRQRSFSKPTGIPQNIPYSGAAQFVGRSHELATLHQ